MTSRTGPTSAAGMWLGVGMGGFVDGILFHQILQLHNMLSARAPKDDIVGAKVNMIWDGLFHLAVWLVTAIGIALLWRAARAPGVNLSTSAFLGGLIFGWGLFNVIEGVVDHHILQLHHVYEAAGQSYWDVVFLVWGVTMLLAGGLLIRSSRTLPPDTPQFPP